MIMHIPNVFSVLKRQKKIEFWITDSDSLVLYFQFNCKCSMYLLICTKMKTFYVKLSHL